MWVHYTGSVHMYGLVELEHNCEIIQNNNWDYSMIMSASYVDDKW